ncbi:MAG TPA: 50S ribosomal protein L9 [Acidimicrobiia bacterium]|nr:50S ribosomal protein L9 [Acidimicrobiia bacterium]
MKIVLREDVETLGNKGDLVDVADGYARNFLVPRGLAMNATRGVVAQAEAMRRNRSARDERDRAEAQDLAAKLTAQPISVVARAGEGGKLFGSITSADIVTAVSAQVGIELDRRTITLTEPLKELGPAEVPVRLHADVEASVTVEVVAE